MLWQTFRTAVQDALALLLPIACPGCGLHDVRLCADCLHELDGPARPASSLGDIEVFSVLRYEARARRMIIQFKEQNRTDAAAALARPLAVAITRALSEHPGAQLVPIPSSRSAARRRGYHPVVLLMRKAGYPPRFALQVARATGRQKSLSLADRGANRAGAYRATIDFSGRRVILVDDIVTSGATLREAARAIRAARGEVVCAATLAFTPRLLQLRDIAVAEDYGKAKGAQR